MGREELKRASGTGASVATPAAATTNGAGRRTEDQGRAEDQRRTKDQEPRTKDPLPKPVLPANIPEYFLSPASASAWRGVLYGAARIHYADARLGVDTVQGPPRHRAVL
jgi:hypothetical protein